MIFIDKGCFMEEQKNTEEKNVENKEVDSSSNENLNNDSQEKESLESKIAEYRKILENMSDKNIETLFKKAEESDVYMDALQRSKADYENYRKRQERDRATFLKYANQDILRNLIATMDNLRRALDSVQTNSVDNSFVEGICLVQKELEKITRDNGVTPIESKGKPFNPTYHEAISQIENADFPEMTVLEEFDCGYLYHDRVLRPSKVVVSKKPVVSNETSDENKTEE